MSKPYIPTFEIIVRRSFDGKIEGERSWKLSAAGSYVDKLEDTIAFVADAAMDAYGMRTAAASSLRCRCGEQSHLGNWTKIEDSTHRMHYHDRDCDPKELSLKTEVWRDKCEHGKEVTEQCEGCGDGDDTATI